ncbi:MAG: dihydrofolate reductase [Anaerolineales bacterium]
MIISLIVAMDEKGGIGTDGQLPWHLSTDLQHFKRVTMGHHLIMGRKTYQSISKKLPRRTMIVLTRDRHFSADGCLLAHSLPEALTIAEDRGEKEVFVIGGASVFREALPLAEQLYLTRVHAVVEADTFFPALDLDSWTLASERHVEADASNQYPFTIRHYLRSQGESKSKDNGGVS